MYVCRRMCLSVSVCKKVLFFSFVGLLFIASPPHKGAGGWGLIFGFRVFFVRFLFFICKCLLDFVVAVSNMFFFLQLTNATTTTTTTTKERKEERKKVSFIWISFSVVLPFVCVYLCTVCVCVLVIVLFVCLFACCFFIM